MQEFISFQLNNQYRVLDYSEFVTMFEEWLNLNGDQANNFGYNAGDTWITQVERHSGISEEEWDETTFNNICSFSPLTFEYNTSNLYNEYLLQYVNKNILLKTPTEP